MRVRTGAVLRTHSCLMHATYTVDVRVPMEDLRKFDTKLALITDGIDCLLTGLCSCILAVREAHKVCTCGPV